MSWQVASFAVLGIVLVGGFAWYERSRPPSAVVALVAALAALAVAGRLAFAAIPNVVATTDIVLFTGYAIGAAPGFAVGALAGLVSNLWLGQGPWTPWQMAGWGMTGVLGAALAAASGRRLGRLPLAAACGIAGIAYGALLNFSLMVTYGGEVSLDRFAVLSARAIPFDLAHAIGNVVLALVAGPAMVRMLVRYRERFEVTWTPARGVAAGLALLVLVAASVPDGGAGAAAPAAETAARGATSAAAWLARAQNRDGGYGAERGSASDPLMSGWAALGLEAAGRNPLDVRRGGHSAVGYMRRHAGSVSGAGDLERTILALAGAGVDPRRFAGRNLVAALRSRRRRDGSWSGQVNLTAFGVLALRAAGVRGGNPRSARWLKRAQNGDGGWGFVRSAPSDVDSTGAALQGIAAAGRPGRAAHRGVAFLRREQVASGGFGLRGQSGANSQSTAWAVQGLLAAGARPARVRHGGRSPFDYLSARQAADGHYRYSRASDQTPVWVTAQALLATERAAFPLQRVPRQAAAGGTAGGRGAAVAGAAGAAPVGPAAAGSTGAVGGGAGGPGAGGGGSGEAVPGGAAEPQSADAPGAEGGPRTVTADRAAARSGRGRFERRGPYALAALGALFAALVGGWFVYRRRLP